MANGETIWAYEDDKKPIMDYGTKYHIGVGIVNDKLTYGEWYDYFDEDMTKSIYDYLIKHIKNKML